MLTVIKLHARPLLTRAIDDGKFDSIAYLRLQKQYNHSEMAHMLSSAAVCVCHSAHRMPMMSQVVRALEAEFLLSNLNEGIPPGHNSKYGLLKLSLLTEFPKLTTHLGDWAGVIYARYNYIFALVATLVLFRSGISVYIYGGFAWRLQRILLLEYTQNSLALTLALS
ncbi:Protein kinase, ATP binding site-containing protein [Artemisia annua]|uniref:non-specific serine/threonine protein kinase n=1 Tax=Artemisia annua TaxID=35608 RepID=A0A2U1PYU1_ARTAN|nr:Protein kinase, ATP binding site-containing protein [Artemisia annua]